MLDIVGGDLCSLGGVILILVLLGRMFADESQKKWGAVLALIAFLTSGAFFIQHSRPRDAGALFEVTLCSLAVFGLVLGLSWCVLPLIMGFARAVRHWMRMSAAASREARENWEREQTALEQRVREEEDRRRETPARRRTEELQQAESAKREKEQKRREDSRASVEMLFQLHQHVLTPRLDKPTLMEWIQRYMSDQHDADYVEERATQMRELILAHLKKIEPEPMQAPSAEVTAARSEVEALYQEHPEIHVLCPVRRFQAEVRVRIPDQAAPEDAWKGARDMMKELLDLVAQEEDRRKSANQPTVPINPPLTNI